MSSDQDLSKSQLDRLGSRLRNAPEPNEEDLDLLNRYREQFVEVSDAVVRDLREISSHPIESRYKSIPSIVAKLRRRTPARLSAIQDLAGARAIVPGLRAQADLIARIVTRFPHASIDDKRLRPSFGYRAVHAVLSAPLPFEVQVRTASQHAWAQLSERLADKYGFELKYGGGPDEVRAALLEYSEFGAAFDRVFDDREVPSEQMLGTMTAFRERLPTILRILRVE